MDSARGRFGAAVLQSQWFFLLLVIVAVSAATGILNPRFLRINNVVNILEQISTLGVVAAGATILIISGNFDISVGSNIGLSASVMAMLIRGGVEPALAVPVGLVLATACSFFVGSTSILFKAPSFIISLACVGVFRGIALALTEARFQNIFGKFEKLGSTRLFGVIPLLFIISLVVYLFVFLLLRYSLLGRRVYAIGSNPQAAYLAGIDINWNKLVFFLINGLLVGVAATMMLSRIGSAQASTGQGMELQAIGAAVIGGAVMSGGKGNILGTFLGVLLMGLISNSLNMLQVSPYFQDVTFGLVIIVAVAASSFRQVEGQSRAAKR
jgi:ribose transport system permease protein